MHDTTLQWTGTADERRDAAIFFARVIAADPSYVSHGEIQSALSFDGASWAPDLERRLIDELSDLSPERSVMIARDGRGAIVGAANITWSLDSAEAPFATLQDLAVEPAMRRTGLGARIVTFFEDEARRRGVKWLFLESGRNNHGAHSFFEQLGYGEVSHVFMKACRGA